MRSLLKTIFLQTAERAVMYLEFDNFSYVYFHASWPLTRRARPFRIPVVCFEIVGLFDQDEPPLVVTPLNSLDSDQARNFIRFQTA